MRLTVCAILVTLLLGCSESRNNDDCPANKGTVLEELEWHKKEKRPIDPIPDEPTELCNVARQQLLQQLAQEEYLRTSGTSGMAQIRSVWEGTQLYHIYGASGPSVGAMHDHSNHYSTVGQGEFSAVLNGVFFRTRHNDYRLVKPSDNAGSYKETEDITQPPVPKSVKNKNTVEEQIEEMREYFKAFYLQDKSIRNYTDFFKPVLCYLEGAWFMNTTGIQESFKSDRHQLDAESWHEMQEKVRFMAATGRKSDEENYAYLPTTCLDCKNGTPIYAQWNYRILCHPLTHELHTSQLHVVDDFASRMSYGKTLGEHAESRAARFQVNPLGEGEFQEGKYIYSEMDQLMGEVPGFDNYGAELEDCLFGYNALKMDTDSDKAVNSAYYLHWSRGHKKGAMGLDTNSRAFADHSCYYAMTTNEDIAPYSITECDKYGTDTKYCKRYTQRWSYAIPWEIIYLTPLHNWNPYDIDYKGDDKYSDEYKSVTKNGRDGSQKSKAYDGINSKLYYHTPATFFSKSGATVSDKADTAKGAVWVKKGGNKYEVSASGITIHIKLDEDMDIRLRYPVMAYYHDGNNVMKEVAALKDYILRNEEFQNIQEGYDVAKAKRHTIDSEEVERGHLKHLVVHEHDMPDPQDVRDARSLGHWLDKYYAARRNDQEK